VLIVLHIPASSRSLLPTILARQTRLPVHTAEDGMVLRAGHVYVAPPDRHLVVAQGRIVLQTGPKENGTRPAVDPMFRSLAAAYGPAAVAVVLSGALGDGSVGARSVAAAGGTVLVQDPADAVVPSMPERTLESVGPAARSLTAGQIGEQLPSVLGEGPELEEEWGMGVEDQTLEASRHRPEGPASGLTCPECHGALWRLDGGDRYRCRIGHAYSEDALVEAQGESVEAALWTALEVLEERAELLQRIADRHGAARPKTQKRMEMAATDALDRAELLRRALAGARGADALRLADEQATA